MNITNKTFEFVIRTDPLQASSVPPVVSVSSVSATSSGNIVITTLNSSILVSLSASAMSNLIQQQYFYTLWMDQGLPDATAMVSGTLFAQLAAATF